MAASEISLRKQELLEAYLRRGSQPLPAALPQRIPRRPVNEAVPLSFGQQQVWVHSHMAGDVPIYNDAITIYRNAPTDAGVLDRCLTEIMRRHEIWRTSFEVRDGAPVQIVDDPPKQFPLRFADLSAIDASQRTAKALQLASDDARRPFELNHAPLLRATLARLGEAEYRLFLTFHHIIFDGVNAYRVLLPELIALYDALSAGNPSPLAEPALQYADYAYWQQTSVDASSWSKDRAFWLENLEGDLPPLEWPQTRYRPNSRIYRGETTRFAFKPALLPALRQFCQTLHVSPYMTLLASFACVLGRYTERDDLVLGGLSAGRKRPELQHVLGYFVNPVALRLDLSGDPRFSELALRVRDTVLDALDHDEMPFEKVVQALPVRPDPGRNPIFQCIVSQQPPLPDLPPEWDLATQEVSNGGAVLDLTVVIDERPDSISGPVIYNSGLFERADVQRLLTQWDVLLSAALADPQRAISELPLMTEREYITVSREWNNTERSFSGPEHLYRLFAAQVERTPESCALICGEQRMTYAELKSKSERLGSHLQTLGVGAEVIVGIYLDASLEMVVALLAVLQAGGACLPLDPALPEDRLAFMLEESGASVLLTRNSLHAGAPGRCRQVICVDDELPPLQTDQAPESAVTRPDDLAFVFFTSGSSGRPKGVAVPHRGLVNCVQAYLAHFSDSLERCLLLYSFGFDGSIPSIFGSLARGGTLVVPPGNASAYLSSLGEVIALHRISHLACVPTLYRHILDTSTPEQLSCIRTAAIAGEQCPKALVERHYAALPHTPFFNLYGPTEGSVLATLHRCEPEDSAPVVPIGRPVANVHTYVLDSAGRLLPPGIAGELHIGGRGVARGYLNPSDLTSQRFVPDLFSGVEGARLYKTGDVVRQRPDGVLEFLGRTDHQVKIRGHRVELEEIEAVLRQHQGVREAAVALDTTSAPALVAYVVPAGAPLDLAQVRQYLQRKLTPAMMPSSFVLLKALPLNANGKVDRSALPSAAPTPAAIQPTSRPADDIEAALLSIWQELLEGKNIGLMDDFFALGGNSLLLVKMMLRIERAFSRKLSLQEVMEAPTILQIAALLRNSQPAAASTAVVPLQPHGGNAPLFWVRGGPLFVPLAQRLGTEQPVLGLHLSPSEIPALERPYRLENIAAALIKHMRAHQPHGPYHLAGLCVNAVIAYEMAVQLNEQGHEVALLALFDAQNPAYYRHFSHYGQTRLLLEKARYHAAKLAHIRQEHAAQYVRDRWAGIVRRARLARWMAEYVLNRPKNGAIDNMDAILQPACRFYSPRPFSGRALFFQSLDWPSGRYWHFSESWDGLLSGGLDLHRIPAGHESMFHEASALAVLAETLQRRLRDVR